LRRILIDPAYIGHLSVNFIKTEWVPRHHPIIGEVVLARRVSQREPDDPLLYTFPPDVCPPMVDAATFEQAQKLLAMNQKSSSRNLK
jgi:hypothetical protein